MSGILFLACLLLLCMAPNKLYDIPVRPDAPLAE